jgi:hypothetical protein
MSVRVAWLIGVACLGACGGKPPASTRGPASPAAPSASAGAASRPAEPKDVAIPKLRTGALEPVDDGAVHDLQVIGRYAGDGYETLATEVPDKLLSYPRALGWSSLPAPVAVDVSPGQPTPTAFLSVHSSDAAAAEHDVPGAGNRDLVWIRRALDASSAPVTGALFDASNLDGPAPGRVLRFRVVGGQSVASDAKVYRQWLRALAGQIMAPLGTPWGSFSAARLRSMAAALDPKKPKILPPSQRFVRSPGSDLSDLATLMDTTTGATAIQETLQNDRPLFALAARQQPSIPIGTLKGPALASHPWKAMLARSSPPPLESLAANVPADFYYVRAADLSSLFRVLDEVDAWGTPSASVLDGAFEDRALAPRYEAALALRRGPLTRALGSAVVGEVAIVGSDPYVKEGSDLTVLLQVRSRPALDAALAFVLAELEREHGSLSRSKRVHDGFEVSVARSPDGAVAQQRAAVGDLEIVSNSAAALDVVLDACKGLHPRLADEPDFQFMLARDAHTPADVLGYMGDRFVGAVVGPRQKVLEARRQIALSELMTPGFAALLYGWTQGKSPAKVEDLFSTSLLSRSEMVHAGGGSIAWRPGEPARSSWGTPASLTPLIDLPVPQAVTASERGGYERFARGYQYNWSAYIDPIAFRIAFAPGDGRPTMTLDLRELPLIDGTQYREIADFVGNARFTAPAPSGGVRSVVGIGPEAWPRRELESTLKGFSSHAIKFDWVGSWASVGLADAPVLASALLQLDPESVPQKPELSVDRKTEGFDARAMATIASLPVYAQIAVKGVAQAALALATLRVVADETIPGMFEWGEIDRYRGVPLVRIRVKKEVGGLVGEGAGIDLFYAVTHDAITLTLQDQVLRRLVDEALDAKGPVPATTPAAPQFSFSLGSDPGKGLWTALAWLAEGAMLREESPAANTALALLRGAPEIAGDPMAQRALALAYFGAVPSTVDGAPFTLARDGVRDPARGTPCAPMWPDIPVPGSALAKVLGSLAAFRSEIGFDDEGKDGEKTMRSLHARVVLDLR